MFRNKIIILLKNVSFYGSFNQITFHPSIIVGRNQSTLVPGVDEHSWLNVQPYSEMPGPKAIPILGNTWRFVPYIGDFNIQEIDKLSKRLHKQYGNVVKVGGLLGRPDMVFVYDANDIERIFRQEEKMPFRPSMPSLEYYKHVLRKDFFSGDAAGVIAVHGESWYNFRSKVQQVILQPRTASMYIGAIEEASLAFIRRINAIKDDKDEVPDNFLNEINKWSLESIARVALDIRLGCMDNGADLETQQLIDAVHTFFINVGILELKIPLWKIFETPTWRQYVRALDTILKVFFRDRAINISCLLQHSNLALNLDCLYSFTSKYTKIAMAKARSGNSESQIKELSLLERVLKLDDNENEKMATILALDLFLVGIDTTANAVASVLYHLSCHPEKQAILHEEIERELPVKDMGLERKHLDNLKYLKACIKETMRMKPVVIGNGRCTTKETTIGGYQVPTGVQIIFQHYVISNQEKYFPRCDEFLPERWLRESGVHHPFASLPFGYGRRMCLGRRFADLEMIIVLSKIMQSFRLEYSYEKLDYHINPLYTPKGPLKLKFIKK